MRARRPTSRRDAAVHHRHPEAGRRGVPGAVKATVTSVPSGSERTRNEDWPSAGSPGAPLVSFGRSGTPSEMGPHPPPASHVPSLQWPRHEPYFTKPTGAPPGCTHFSRSRPLQRSRTTRRPGERVRAPALGDDEARVRAAQRRSSAGTRRCRRPRSSAGTPRGWWPRRMPRALRWRRTRCGWWWGGRWCSSWCRRAGAGCGWRATGWGCRRCSRPARRRPRRWSGRLAGRGRAAQRPVPAARDAGGAGGRGGGLAPGGRVTTLRGARGRLRIRASGGRRAWPTSSTSWSVAG